MPQQQTDWSAWDRWCQSHIERALAQHAFNQIQIEAIGQALAEIRAQLRKEFEAEIASLRADMTVQTAIVRGQISYQT